MHPVSNTRSDTSSILGAVGMRPPKNDRWPEPKHWRHAWLKVDVGHQPPAPSFVLLWLGGHRVGWKAFIVYVDEIPSPPAIRFAVVDAARLKPAKSDRNVWNEGSPRR